MGVTYGLQTLHLKILCKEAVTTHVVRSLMEMQQGTAQEEDFGILQTSVNAQLKGPVISLHLPM